MARFRLEKRLAAYRPHVSKKSLLLALLVDKRGYLRAPSGVALENLPHY